MSVAVRPIAVTTALVASFAVSSQAMGQSGPVPPYSADIEFVRPSFGHNAFTGIDVPDVRKAFAFRYGLVAQYARNPMTLYDGLAGEELGSIIQNRLNFGLGFSIDLSERFTVNALLPIAVNSGFSPAAEPYANNGAGLGDVGMGARVILLRSRNENFALGIRGALFVPTGRQSAYTSEPGLRANAGLQAMLNVGPVMFASDASVMTRGSLDTNEDFFLGNELLWNTGVRYSLPQATRTALTAQLLTRAGFNDFILGQAENGLEAIGGLQVYPSQSVTVDLGVGRGFNLGYGTSDMRIITGVTMQRAPKPVVRPQVVTIPPPPPVPPPPLPDVPPEPEWEVGELAKIVEEEIVIRDMLEFKVGTTILLEQSRPTLRAIAKILSDMGEIGHLVVEGHASEEGSFDYNYNLSVGRARAIFQELLSEGVHPTRLSYRGMGEVEPKIDESTEEAYQANRRVEFHIVRQFGADEARPEFPEVMKLPWNGEPVKVQQPPKPEPVEEAPKDDSLRSLFDTEDDEFEMDDAPRRDRGSRGNKEEAK